MIPPAEKLSSKINCVSVLIDCMHMYDSSSELSAVELDDEGGRTFLRVLIHLIMQDYPPLVSGSLQLIFKHFSQRAEVLQAFKQVANKESAALGTSWLS